GRRPRRPTPRVGDVRAAGRRRALRLRRRAAGGAGGGSGRRRRALRLRAVPLQPLLHRPPRGRGVGGGGPAARTGRRAVTAPAQLPLELDHRPALAREDFLVVPSNALAVAWIDRWPDWPAPALALYGPPGSGKTHLCQVWRQVSGAVEVTAEMLRRDEPPAWLGEARACVVEGVADSLEKEPEVARRLLHLYNMMAERGGFLLLC